MKSFVGLCVLLCLLPAYTICAQEEEEQGDPGNDPLSSYPFPHT